MVSVLRGEGLAFAYPGPLRALAGVDIELAEHELLAVIGPNGSGKSTLLRVLAGLLTPDAGRVRILGRDLEQLSARERAQTVALVPQALPVLPEVTARRFVLGGRYARVGRLARPEDHEAVARALAAADAADLEQRALAELSGGQRQRVLVARALAQEAHILLVDEPTAALDAGHQVLMFDLLARLADQGRGALVVTHDLNLASQFASRVCCLDQGRVVTTGRAEEVLTEAVLAPVYGPHLHFGRIGPVPFVLPWLQPDRPPRESSADHGIA